MSSVTVCNRLCYRTGRKALFSKLEHIPENFVHFVQNTLNPSNHAGLRLDKMQNILSKQVDGRPHFVPTGQSRFLAGLLLWYKFCNRGDFIMYKKACQAHLWVHKGQVRIKILRPCEHDELRWLVESESEWDGELKTKRMFYTLVLLHQNTRIILSGYNRSELGGVAPISEYLNIVDYLKNRGISWQDPTQPWRNSTSR